MPYSPIELFNTFHDCSLGTLWRVREDLIKERVAPYDQNSDRYCHAALSVKRGAVAENLERVPMLIGRKRRKSTKTVRVRGIFPSYPPESVTHFGQTIAPLLMADFTEPAPDASGKLTGDLLECKRVTVNSHKPKIDENEKKQLMAWMARRGF